MVSHISTRTHQPRTAPQRADHRSPPTFPLQLADPLRPHCRMYSLQSKNLCSLASIHLLSKATHDPVVRTSCCLRSEPPVRSTSTESESSETEASKEDCRHVFMRCAGFVGVGEWPEGDDTETYQPACSTLVNSNARRSLYSSEQGLDPERLDLPMSVYSHYSTTPFVPAPGPPRPPPPLPTLTQDELLSDVYLHKSLARERYGREDAFEDDEGSDYNDNERYGSPRHHADLC